MENGVPVRAPSSAYTPGPDATTSAPPHVPRERGIGSAEFAQLKLDFLASLNHEIRTPLSGIVGMTDLLMETSLDTEQREYVSAVRQCADELSALLNATLEYTSLASGPVRMDETEFQVADALQSAAADIAARAKEKGLKFITKLDSSLSQLSMGDPVRIKQIASLLLSNAVKFTADGQVELSGEMRPAASGWELAFRVTDTGIGMTPEDLERVLQTYCQLEGGLARRFSGLGLGLALVRKLLDLMSGSLHASSTPGGGSQFEAHIPLRARHAQPQRAGEAVRLTPRESRILLVEDNRISQQVISYMLNKAGYQHDCAESGIEAVHAAASNRYHAILMDIQMPGMDGIEATQRIRELPDYRVVPILALTANSADEVRSMCRDAGMDGYLVKPVQANDLLDALRRSAPSAA